MPDTWHICASSLQNPRATLSWTLREKLIHAQRVTVIPLIIFCANGIKIFKWVKLRKTNKFWHRKERKKKKEKWDLIHHIPLAYLGQAIFFLPRLMIFQLHRLDNNASQVLNIWPFEAIRSFFLRKKKAIISPREQGELVPPRMSFSHWF